MIKQIGMKLGCIAAVLAFQGVTVMDARGLHGCPQHDALPAGLELAEGQDGGASAGHGHDAHDAGSATQIHEGHAALVDVGASHGGHEGPCTCVGSCALGPNAPVAASLDGTLFAAIAAPWEGAPATYLLELLPGAPSHLLPFSQGPPHLA
jgi:hypothetical protein